MQTSQILSNMHMMTKLMITITFQSLLLNKCNHNLKF